MRYVHLPASAVDTALLEDATRRGLFLTFDVSEMSSSTADTLILSYRGGRASFKDSVMRVVDHENGTTLLIFIPKLWTLQSGSL